MTVGADTASDAVAGLQDEDVASGLLQPAGTRQTCESGPDDDNAHASASRSGLRTSVSSQVKPASVRTSGTTRCDAVASVTPISP